MTSDTSWSYDAQGRLLVSETDNESDGIVDRQSLYTYDELGNLVLEESKTHQSTGNWSSWGQSYSWSCQ